MENEIKDKKITNRFNINDEVWILYNKKVISVFVKEITLIKNDIIRYSIKEEGFENFIFLDEKDVFASKEELIHSL